MTEMVDPCEVLRTIEEYRFDAVERALCDDAQLADIGAAATAVFVVAEFRKKFGFDDPAYGRFDEVYRTCLTARLMELGEGNLGADEIVVAAMISASRP